MNERRLDPSQVPCRTPVVSNSDIQGLELDKIKKQWCLVKAAICKSIKEYPEVRSRAARFVTELTDEKLPERFIEEIYEVDERVAKMRDRYRLDLTALLGFDAVPDELITPDVKHAQLHTPPEEIVELYRSLGEEATQDTLRGYMTRGLFHEGITSDEKFMVMVRYEFARDVKTLALAAEILEQEDGLRLDANGEAILPSGTHIISNVPSGSPQEKDLLNPLQWKKRHQLKDRVYEIQIGERQYILKERKTARHRDTWKQGHRDGLSSQEEIEIANELNEKATVEEGDIKVSWEKVVGAVTYPDGFQFAIFEYEQELVEQKDATPALYKAILDNRPQFEDEYQEISQACSRRYIPQVIVPNLTEIGNLSLLSFEEYAQAKAHAMLDRVGDIQSDIMAQNQIENVDLKSTMEASYRIHTHPKVTLEFVGFDLEYARKIDKGISDKKLLAYKLAKKRIKADKMKSLSIHSQFSGIQIDAYNRLYALA